MASPATIDGWRNRIVRVEVDVDPNKLTPNPHNWRTHPSLQQDALGGVLGDIGWVGQVMVNERNGHVVDGHLRVEMARRTGRKVPTVAYVDLTDEEEAVILATFDPLSAAAETDADSLRALMEAGGITDGALRDMLAPFLTPEEVMGNDDLVGGDSFGQSVGFVVTAIAKNAAQRDAFVAALEAAGASPTVAAHRE